VTSMMRTGAQIILAKLLEHNTTHVFEYPGGSICPILDELSRSERVTIVTTRHEQAAIHAADGYARVTRRPAVCIATSGPGASNLVTGIANAFMDSVPLVIITGQVATWDLKNERRVRQRGFQEIDIVSIAKPIAKAAYLARKVEELPALLDQAFLLAQSGRPGPVLIDVPINLQYTASRISSRKKRASTGQGLPCAQSAVDKAAERLIASPRPLVVVGGGVGIANAERELRLLLDKHKLPSVQTLMGLSSVSADSPLSLGFIGYAGRLPANTALIEADCILGLGTRFDNRAFPDANKNFGARASLIQVDCDRAELGHRVKVDLAMHADVKVFLRQFAKSLARANFICPAEWRGHVEGLLDSERRAQVRGKGHAVTPQELLSDISEALREKTYVVTTDVGQHQLWTAQNFRFNKHSSLLTSGGLGTMGFGLPAAIGAQFALPYASVIVITSDGSIQMNIQELATVKEYGLPIKIFVLNNRCLGLVRQIQEFAFEGRFACTRTNGDVDFVSIARAYGISAMRITRRQGLRRIVESVVAAPRSVLVEVMIDETENVYPVRVKGRTIFSGHG